MDDIGIVRVCRSFWLSRGRRKKGMPMGFAEIEDTGKVMIED